jgi:hypothetical protein
LAAGLTTARKITRTDSVIKEISMKTHQLLALLITAAVGLGPGACGDAGTDEDQATVRVITQGASSVSDMIDVVLATADGGVRYYFYLTGVAADPYSHFTLNIHKGGDATGPLVYTVDFDLPIDQVLGTPGETGSGDIAEDIVPGPNSITIDFSWNYMAPDNGDTSISMVFTHAPEILTWSKIPGPGSVVSGDIVAVQAHVIFYGTGTKTVTAQFVSAGSLVGTAGALSDPDLDGIWNGTVTAVSGADTLRLTATDDDGTSSSEVPFAVP